MSKSRDLITADHAQMSAFDTALHRGSTKAQGGLRAMMNKDSAAQNVAMNEYFHHWDDKKPENETKEIREARTADYASITRQYEALPSDEVPDDSIFR